LYATLQQQPGHGAIIGDKWETIAEILKGAFSMAKKTSLPPNVPAVGTLAPDFELPADNGQPVRLSDYRGQRVVLYFYPKDMTSGCTTQACGFRDSYPEITERNAVVLGISPDGVASHVKFKSKYNLPFRLLADEDHKVAELYGVWGEKSMYGKKYYGIIRSHFVIDEQGRIADVQYNISPEESVESALAALRLG
jgi:peroxiredoxin Q/BCP